MAILQINIEAKQHAPNHSNKTKNPPPGWVSNFQIEIPRIVREGRLFSAWDQGSVSSPTSLQLTDFRLSLPLIPVWCLEHLLHPYLWTGHQPQVLSTLWRCGTRY